MRQSILLGEREDKVENHDDKDRQVEEQSRATSATRDKAFPYRGERARTKMRTIRTAEHLFVSVQQYLSIEIHGCLLIYSKTGKLRLLPGWLPMRGLSMGCCGR